MTKRESLAIDKTSRRLELQQSSGKRKKSEDWAEKASTGLLERAMGSRGFVDAS